jgi:hypothetical protein
LRAVPTPVLALDVQRGKIPGAPGANRTCESLNACSSRRKEFNNPLTIWWQTGRMFASKL